MKLSEILGEADDDLGDMEKSYDAAGPVTAKELHRAFDGLFHDLDTNRDFTEWYDDYGNDGSVEGVNIEFDAKVYDRGDRFEILVTCKGLDLRHINPDDGRYGEIDGDSPIEDEMFFILEKKHVPPHIDKLKLETFLEIIKKFSENVVKKVTRRFKQSPFFRDFQRRYL